MSVDTTTADPLLGALLDGRYRIDARLARGGMATVYSGFDTRLDRSVAIKVMHPSLADDDAFVDRFRREAKSAARLSHPNVVAVYDAGVDPALGPYLVYEYVAGRTLRARIGHRDEVLLLEVELEAHVVRVEDRRCPARRCGRPGRRCVCVRSSS